jgi:Family of unknown function (DUF6174)
MRRLKTPAARWALGAALIAALGGGLIAAFQEGLALRAPNAAAKARWAAGTTAHYRMVVETGSPCRLEIEVRDEHVAAVLYADACGHPARTVTDLFQIIERAPSPLYTCAPPNCACRNVVSVYALYDERLGYPQRIAVLAEREPNWRTMRFWRYVWSERRLPDCAWSSSADIVNVRSMTPLQ